jgi:hypothetical protein
MTAARGSGAALVLLTRARSRALSQLLSNAKIRGLDDGIPASGARGAISQ